MRLTSAMANLDEHARAHRLEGTGRGVPAEDAAHEASQACMGEASKLQETMTPISGVIGGQRSVLGLG
jgi:hypothetical protein